MLSCLLLGPWNDVVIEPAEESDFDDDIADKDYELPTAKVTYFFHVNND